MKLKTKYFVLLLLLVLITSICVIYKVLNNRGSPIENITKKEEINYDTNFALMIEQDDGTYIESTSTKWPDDYKLNIEKSKCVDKDGNVLNNALSVTKKIIEVKTTTTTYCYLYFDSYTDTEKLMEDEDVWESTLEDDGYRFVGTNPDNYICFGTTDKNECTSDTDKYMYRIIGIFEETDGKQHLKLIKKEALNRNYTWNEDYENDVNWENSDLYKGINGSYFLTNATYNYMQDSIWINKIEEWTWTATNTQSFRATRLGVYYYYSWPIGIYNSEHKINTTIGCYYNSYGGDENCATTASYTHPEAKIGLMYASDYALSLGETAVTMTEGTYINRSTLKTGWMHISNSDSGAPSQYEWTIGRYGMDDDDDYYDAWCVFSDGRVDGSPVQNIQSVRPAFYLTSNVELTGEGTITNPYIITN